jgi:hypothetical protein
MDGMEERLKIPLPGTPPFKWRNFPGMFAFPLFSLLRHPFGGKLIRLK